MQLKARTAPFDAGCNAQILHNDAVQTSLIHVQNKALQLFQLRLPCQYIHREINPHSEQMRLSDHCLQLILVKIIRIGSRPELLPCQINSVRPGIHGSPKRLHIAGRCQKLHSFAVFDCLFCLIRHVHFLSGS